MDVWNRGLISLDNRLTGCFSEVPLLRRATPIATDDELENSGSQHPDADRRAAERRSVEGDVHPEFERRTAERRSMDSLRADMQWTPVADDDELFGTLRRSKPVKTGMKRSRILMLAVAVLAGGAAAFIAIQQPPAQQVAQPVTEYVQEPMTKILVAKDTISVGQRLSSNSISWEEWPQDSVRVDYITAEQSPDAIVDMAGSVARYEIFPGEAIRADKLVSAAQGNLSAVLGSGVVGVSVSVAAGSASGGFISPNDHVDVVLTKPSVRNDLSESSLQSETILHNVRVLAINARLGEAGNASAREDESNAGPEVFTGEAMATLELDPKEAEVVINASAIGKLSLVLRSVSDFAETNKVAQRGANAAIRISSPFWGN